MHVNETPHIQEVTFVCGLLTFIRTGPNYDIRAKHSERREVIETVTSTRKRDSKVSRRRGKMCGRQWEDMGAGRGLHELTQLVGESGGKYAGDAP